MTDEFDQPLHRPRESSRDALYKRRSSGVESVSDEAALAANDYFDVAEPIDDSSVDIFYLVDRLKDAIRRRGEMPGLRRGQPERLRPVLGMRGRIGALSARLTASR